MAPRNRRLECCLDAVAVCCVASIPLWHSMFSRRPWLAACIDFLIFFFCLRRCRRQVSPTAVAPRGSRRKETPPKVAAERRRDLSARGSWKVMRKGKEGGKNSYDTLPKRACIRGWLCVCSSYKAVIFCPSASRTPSAHVDPFSYYGGP